MTESPRPIETQALGAHVPERMRSAITRALAKNKDERFSSVKEFFEAFASGAAGAGAPHTAAMGAPMMHADAAAVSAPGQPRAMTEMAAPVAAMGPAPHAMTPAPYAGPGSSPGSNMGAAIPAGPAHGSPHGGGEKKGGMGLIIGLGVLAILLIGGGVTAFALKGKPKTTTGDPLAGLSATTTETAIAVESATAPPPIDSTGGTTAPLDTSASTAVAANTAAAKTGTTPTKPATSAGPVPTPKIKPAEPPKVDPPICARARDALARKSSAATNLVAQCKAAGGTP